MPADVYKYRGIEISIWKTSFQITGMSNKVIYLNSIDPEAIMQFYDAVYQHCYDQAKEDALADVMTHIKEVIS